MNFRQSFLGREHSFQIAPLVDIVFLLLTFFIVTGALADEEKATPIKLPTTTSAVTRKREKLDIVVNVTRDGRIRINDQDYSVEKLRRVLADVQQSARSVPVSVIIRADGKALHEDVMRVIDACRAAKLRNAWFVSIDTGEREHE